VRYRNSFLGFFWSLLNPLAYMVILTLVFSFLLRVQVQGFAAWVLVGILVWRFFALGTNQGLFSIINNASLVNKVYIPRYLIVLASNLASLLGASLELVVLFPLLIFLGAIPSLFVAILPLILLSEFSLVFGLSLALSTLNVVYRDFYQLWDIALQLGFFLSPIVYDSNLIPLRFRLIYSLNPVTRLIESTRDILLSNRVPTIFDAMTIAASSVILVGVGAVLFNHMQERIAEEV